MWSHARIHGLRVACLSLLLLMSAAPGCDRDPSTLPVASDGMPPPRVSVRFATWNVSLYRNESGGLIRMLEGDATQAKQLAAVIQHLRPDVLLLNEFDFDPDGRAAQLFQRRYLEIGQDGQPPIRYDFHYAAPVNTGEPSGLDLDGDGNSDGANDAWGFGKHPGQYGMLLLSRYRIDAVAARSFRLLRWSAMPDAHRPIHPDGTPYHDDSIWKQLRLSSKSHWDVPVETPLGTVHVLASHPTPPVFDGPENLNGLRNHDEIRLWSHYLSAQPAPWLCDDAGRCGGLAPEQRFVLMGDMNSDPDDGDGVAGTANLLLRHPRINASRTPLSEGATQQAMKYGLARSGNARAHTGDFGPRTGTLRLDYVLPSSGLQVLEDGVFWPLSPPQHVEWVSASDHHLVWVDVTLPP